MYKMSDISLILDESLLGVVNFFHVREQHGGFSAGRYMPATVEDTYHAVRCLRLVIRFRRDGSRYEWESVLKMPVITHMGFITERLRGDWNNSRRLFQLLYCAYSLKSDFLSYMKPVCSMEKINNFLSMRMRRTPVLDECFHAARITDMLNCFSCISLDNLPVMADSSIKYISELRRSAYLHRHAGWRHWNDMQTGGWSEWLKLCRNGDGGYGFFPGTTSYMENVYEAFESFRLLGILPERVDSTVGFIRACRSARGGFGRRCQGIPFPDSTWYGVSVLMNLLSMDFTR